MKNKKVTMQSISEDLGISKTTVSLVLKGDGDKYRISRETQKKIIEYSEEAGFVPDFLARALATKKTATIGIIFPDVHESFMSEMLKGIESVLYQSDYSLMLSTSGFDSEIEMRNIRQMLRRKVDGLIIVPYLPIAEEKYEHSYPDILSKSDCPSVFIDRVPEESSAYDWVVQDDFEAAVSAVELLAEKGCRNIGCISFDLKTSSIVNRLEGYKAGLVRCGLDFSEDNLMLLNKQDPQSDDLSCFLKDKTGIEDGFDGLLITTGGLAHKTGYLLNQILTADEIPLIAKFGRDPDYFNTGMIQIIQPNIEMGETAARQLLIRINEPEIKPVHLTIKSKIIDKED